MLEVHVSENSGVLGKPCDNASCNAAISVAGALLQRGAALQQHHFRFVQGSILQSRIAIPTELLIEHSGSCSYAVSTAALLPDRQDPASQSQRHTWYRMATLGKQSPLWER